MDNLVKFTQLGMKIPTMFYVHMMPKGRLDHCELKREKIYISHALEEQFEVLMTASNNKAFETVCTKSIC